MKIGWIIQNRWTDQFVENSCATTSDFKEAFVFATRKAAREDRFVDAGEVVHKVELYKNGKAKKILPERVKVIIEDDKEINLI